MPHSLLKKIGNYDTDLRPHNIVFSNYEGKTSKALGVIQVDIVVDTIVRPTLLMIILTIASYNLLLCREWIHDIGEIPSTLH